MSDATPTQPASPIRVAVVEDSAPVRATLASVLDASGSCSCVATCASGETAIAELPPLRPDVVLMDINLPGMNGVACVMKLAPLLPQTQIVMLTVYQDTKTIFQALAAGAHGYLVKPVAPSALIEAVTSVQAGGSPMTGTIARLVVDTFRQPATGPGAVEELAPREREVLDLLSKGFVYKEIAEHLGIKLTTVATYVQRIYEKLHVRGRREAIARYLGLPG